MAFDYTTLITSEHVKAPNFVAWVGALTSVMGAIADCAAGLPAAIDVDSAIGAQLDIDGLWVGASRRVDVPLNVYFSLDTAGLGFDEGVWWQPGDPLSGVQYLDDETYRAVIRTKIAVDHWDGTLTTYQDLADAALHHTGAHIRAVDHQDMTMTVHIVGTPLTPIMQALYESGRLTAKPAGVAITYL